MQRWPNDPRLQQLQSATTMTVTIVTNPPFKLVGTAPEHKRYVLFDSAGHVPPRLDVVREILDWLDRYFGPVPHRAKPTP